ncbi:MAG: acylphosphatase [Chloroflexi bacterium]|nr:MAG: acylphosphatase [Chloroflexota bacterium]
MTNRIEAQIYGKVQGVSFRHYTQKKASHLNLTGWVANVSDGSVRVVAEGEEDKLKQLIIFLHIGSPFAQVDQVDVSWTPATGHFHQFSVRWQ